VELLVLPNIGIGLVLEFGGGSGGCDGGDDDSGFLLENIDMTYVGYGPCPLKSFRTMVSKFFRVVASTVNSHSR
jgi:hypothetical protein